MVKTAEVIYHICQRKDWEAAQETGTYRAASLESEGFIHCSREDQVARVANFIFQGMTDLVLLHITVDKLQAEVRWEGSKGEIFPHIYGPIDLDAVVDVVDFVAGDDGFFMYP